MGVKGESTNRPKAIATDEQMRLARLTLEGNSVDEDPANIQRLIKRVIETTRCSQARAELALYDNDNDLAAAIDYILEHGSEIEAWTEQKSKKDKKKEEEDKRPTRGQPSTRGRGGFSERGGRGRGRGDGAFFRGASRNASAAADRGRGNMANAGGIRPLQSKPLADDPVTKSLDNDSIDDATDWKSGPMVFHRTEDHSNTLSSSNPSVPVSQPSTTPPTPISFAAVAAAAAKKDLKRQQAQPTNSVTINEQCGGTALEFHSDGTASGKGPAIDKSQAKD
ncbi:hypothetical protein KIN20_031735, partial [Parelaphostrongylus tenuis]